VFYTKRISRLGNLGDVYPRLSSLILSHRIPLFPLVSAFVLFAVGCFNIILGLVVREKVHLYRAWGVSPPNDVEAKQALPKSRRFSFRPRGKRSTALSSAGNMNYPDVEKLPVYRESHEPTSQSKQPHGIHKPPRVVVNLGFGRQAQQGTETEWCCLPIPEHSRPKY
jgi:hypothetical protein